MSLKNYTENDLREELARREAERELLGSIKVVIDKTPVQEIESKLVKLAQSYLEDELNERELDTQWAYEQLMQLVYGNDVFDKLNKLRR